LKRGGNERGDILKGGGIKACIMQKWGGTKRKQRDYPEIGRGKKGGEKRSLMWRGTRLIFLNGRKESRMGNHHHAEFMDH